MASYAGTEDTELMEASPSTSQGSRDLIEVEDKSGDSFQGLLDFSGIIGTGPGQIPSGATVLSASLELIASDAGGGQISMHRMLRSWDESSTWDSLGNGVQRDDVEAVSAADATIDPTVTGLVTITGLEATVQDWVNGGPSEGWAFFSNSDDGWDFRTSEYSTVAERPRLVVTYDTGNSPPVFDQDLGDRSDAEGDVVSLPSPATDPDLDTLTYSATGLPPGLSIDSGSGLISGAVAPGASSGSPYSVEGTVTDGSLIDTDTFTWFVTTAVGLEQVHRGTVVLADGSSFVTDVLSGVDTAKSSATMPMVTRSPGWSPACRPAFRPMAPRLSVPRVKPGPLPWR